MKSSNESLKSTEMKAKEAKKSYYLKKRDLTLLQSRLNLLKKITSAFYLRGDKFSGYRNESLILINQTKQLNALNKELAIISENLILNSFRNNFNSTFPSKVNVCDLDQEGEIIGIIAEDYRRILNLTNPTNSVESDVNIVLYLIEQLQNLNLDPNLRLEYRNFAELQLSKIYTIYQNLISTKKSIEDEMLSFDATDDSSKITIDPYYLLFKYYHFLDKESVDLQQEKSLILTKDQCLLLLNIIKARYKVFIEYFNTVINLLPENIQNNILSA